MKTILRVALGILATVLVLPGIALSQTTTTTTSTVPGAHIATVTRLGDEVTPRGYTSWGTITMSPGYAGGGDTFSTATVCGSSARRLDVLLVEGTVGDNHYEIDEANAKILARVGSSQSEVAAETDLSTVVVRFLARCK